MLVADRFPLHPWPGMALSLGVTLPKDMPSLGQPVSNDWVMARVGVEKSQVSWLTSVQCNFEGPPTSRQRTTFQ